MGWGQGIGIGWPNASASAAPPVPQERYSFYNCVNDEYNNSSQYPVGSFLPEHRVVIDNSVYGYIIEAIPPGPGGSNISNLPIGYVADRCNDCNVTFSFDVSAEGSDRWINLYATVDGDVNFESTTNELIVNVNYEIYFTAPDDPPITMSGTVTFEIDSYNVPTEDGPVFMQEQYAFNLSEDYSIAYEQFYVTSMSVNPIALGPYATDWYIENRYVTEYGNVWSFYYPTAE